MEREVDNRELEEIKTEYRIRSEYADYAIQLQRKKHFVVEVKSIELDLNERHLRQSLSYAANEGIDWILLMNGRQIELYRVNFAKPVTTTLIFKLDLLDPDDFKKAPDLLWYLSKKAARNASWKTFGSGLTPCSRLTFPNYCIRRTLSGVCVTP